jgi:hypothetical protein
MTHDKTLKLVTNLGRPEIEAKLAEVRQAAQVKGLSALAQQLAGIEGLPRGQMETRIKGALKLLAGNAEHQGLGAQLELIELNLPNLK